MRGARTLLLVLTGAALALGAGLWLLARRTGPQLPEATLTVTGALGADDTEGFARALAPRPLHFPGDHGPHPDFRSEWWYWTGNLQTSGGRHVGYQLTLFRSALAPRAPARASAWATRQVYLAHFALSDTAGERFHAFERFSRGALGLAGAHASPFRVWVEDWSAESLGAPFTPLRLRAAADGVAIDLVLEEGKPVVLQGERGLSQKGPEPGNASYYYSFTRMPTRGTVTLGDTRLEVTGASWMDREWSTSALSEGQQGWDWFSLQLSDGSELMYYQLRRVDGSADAHSAGTLVRPDGSSVRLSKGDVRLEVLDTWTSPRTGVRYPSRWRLTAPSAGLRLTIRPRLPDQELPVSVRYWEGAVRLEGEHGGQPVDGVGYVELTGYADAPGTREHQGKGQAEAERPTTP